LRRSSFKKRKLLRFSNKFYNPSITATK